MRTKRFFTVVIVVIMSLVSMMSLNAQEKTKYIPINGDTNYYVKAFGGYALNAKGAVAGGAVGMRINAFRLEVEGKYAEKNPSMLGLANVDLIKGRFTPFLTAGAGAGKQVKGFEQVENPETGEIEGVQLINKFQFQWTVGGGVSYRIAPHFQLEVAYRLNGFPSEAKFVNDRPALVEETQLSDAAKRTILNMPLNKIDHEVRIAIRYHF